MIFQSGGAAAELRKINKHRKNEEKPFVEFVSLLIPLHGSRHPTPSTMNKRGSYARVW